MNNNLVSIYITTYFHEKYIAQALDSVIAQEVSFPIEIIVSDDASGDNTVEIVKDYMKRYDFITLNVNDTNIGLTANVFKAKSLCKGKYIADLSGDDYWIDNFKLKKQVDYLDEHNEYYAVCCRTEIRCDDEQRCVGVVPNDKECGVFTLEDFLQGKNIPMNGIVFRNPFVLGDGNYFGIMPKMSKYIDDLTDNLLILSKSNAFILPDVMVAYRVRSNNSKDQNFNSINKGLDSYCKHIELLNNLFTVFGKKYDLFYRYRMIVSSGIKKAFLSHDFRRFWNIYKTVPDSMKKRGLLFASLLFEGKKMIKRLVAH